jgi:hypothetical protein
MSILFLTLGVKIKVCLIEDENDCLFSLSDRLCFFSKKKKRIFLKHDYIIPDTSC